MTIRINNLSLGLDEDISILKKKARLYELPISYYGREYNEGKKITWKDGIHAIIALIRFRFSD